MGQFDTFDRDEVLLVTEDGYAFRADNAADCSAYCNAHSHPKTLTFHEVSRDEVVAFNKAQPVEAEPVVVEKSIKEKQAKKSPEPAA